METIIINDKEYKLDVEKAKELGLLKAKDTKPRSWSEYCNNAGRNIYDKFSSCEESKAFVALGKLIQLRDAWLGEWTPDWNNSEDKYYIWVLNGEMCIGTTIFSQCMLAFPTEEMRDDFLETFLDIIEQAKMFL